jgi:predicted RecA/RadA family phage recombinase
MRNFVQPGDVVTLTAPYAVASGGGLLVGVLFGVATSSADENDLVEAKLTGVFELPKIAAQAWAEGERVYWENSDKKCTTSPVGTTLIGVAVAVADNPSDTGIVRLNGTVPPEADY